MQRPRPWILQTVARKGFCAHAGCCTICMRARWGSIGTTGGAWWRATTKVGLTHFSCRWTSAAKSCSRQSGIHLMFRWPGNTVSATHAVGMPLPPENQSWSNAGMEPSAPQFVDVQRWEMDVPWPMTVGTLLVRSGFCQAVCILIV